MSYNQSEELERRMKLNEIEKRLEKLNKLEVIEEELGIDLITLFKVMKKRWVVEKISRGYMDVEIDGLSYTEESMLCYDNDNCCTYNDLPFKEYGKTWALTREELENG